MKAVFSLIAFLILSSSSPAQQWVDTVYNISLTQNVQYGSAIDFAGNTRTLALDIAVPSNDIPPSCGRPLFIFVHGGGFISGDKSDPSSLRWINHFAKRGYAAASVGYRLGMFQTSQSRHCNVTQLFGTPWDCLNMADTLEWYRAWYRGVQDVKGAIRYLIANSSTYGIDPEKVFITGESAGGFIAMGVSYLDSVIEKPVAANGLSPALAPNMIYEQICIQGFDLDTSIASLDLSRPDLGSIEGDLHPQNDYKIQACANIYGALMTDLFTYNTYDTPPALYLFHQPNDLIVPFGRDQLFAGYSYCFAQPPFNCAYLINNPVVYGSQAIKSLIDSLDQQGRNVPFYSSEFTNNIADCIAQYFNPTLGGHSIDNYFLRSSNIAQFFSGQLDTTCIVSADGLQDRFVFLLYPNPAATEMEMVTDLDPRSLSITDITGKKVEFTLTEKSEHRYVLIPEARTGIYFLNLTDGIKRVNQKLILQR